MIANWTNKALLRLQQIHDYIAQENPKAANELVDQLTRQAATMATQPHAGIKVKEYQRDDIREIYNGRYRLIYRIHQDRIDVLTVRHGMRLMPTHVKNL
jgi:addiction module RelE/StbE family toxin